MPLSVVSGSLRESDLATSMSQGAFMVNMEQALRGDTSTKDYVDSALVMLAVCNESLHAYLNSIAMMQSAADQDHVAYSNIEGGVGIFASRRAHLVQAVKTDQSDIAPYGLHYLLESLDVSFGR